METERKRTLNHNIMSGAKQTDSEQTGNESAVSRVVGGVDGVWYAKLLVAAVLGLVANTLVMLAVVGGDVLSIADGVAFLAPAVVLAAWVHDRKNPVDMAYIGPAVLFVTILAANTISLSVRVYRQGIAGEPLMTALLLGFLALLFAPGPFLAVWATRRWWSDE